MFLEDIPLFVELKNNNKYMCSKPNTKMFIIHFSGNKFRLFRPLSVQHYKIKKKIGYISFVWVSIYTSFKIC
jgi:hypothetical protein